MVCPILMTVGRWSGIYVLSVIRIRQLSLRLTKHDIGVHTLIFEFDATQPCSVRVYYFATEVVDDRNMTVR